VLNRLASKRIPELAELSNFSNQQPLNLTAYPRLTLRSFPAHFTMLSRTIRRSIASPFRRNVVAPAARPAFRFVTTDAASSQADPANVPSVRGHPERPIDWLEYAIDN
jgi:hypothetical protein